MSNPPDDIAQAASTASAPRPTPAPMRELDRSLVRGVVWSGAAKWTAQALTWASTLVVARLLTPADYGVVGMAWLYLGLQAMITEFGIGSAVVTMRDLSAKQIRQLNTVAVSLGVAALAISLALARPLAAFFDEPRLRAVIVVLSAGAVIAGLRVVPGALLQKELRFRALASFEAAHALVSALAALGFATAGLGYWALVWGALLGGACHSALVVRARPQSFAVPRRHEIGAATSFSRNVLLSRVSWYAYDNADFLVAGKVLGTSLLGSYRMAWTFGSMPLDKIVSLVGRVTPAVLSKVQSDKPELRRYLLRLTEAMSLIVFPFSIGLMLVAEDFVRAILGEKWLPAVAPLRILSLYACVRGISPLWAQTLMVTGDTAYLMRISVVGALVLPIGFVVGSHWGLVGVALTWVILGPPLIVVPILRRVLAKIELPMRDYAPALVPAAGAAAVMAVVVMATQHLMPFSHSGVRLAVAVTVGAIAYPSALLLLWRTKSAGLLKSFAAAFRAPR